MTWKLGSYWRPRPSIVINALNISVRSEGMTIEWLRMIAANCLISGPMRMSLSGTPSYSNTSSFTSAASLTLVDVGVARPVEQHVEHRLFLHLREPREEVDHLVAARRAQAPDHAESIMTMRLSGRIEHIAGMRIGVEEAVDQDHPEDRFRAARGEQLRVEPAARTAARSVPGMPSMCCCTFMTSQVHSGWTCGITM